MLKTEAVSWDGSGIKRGEVVTARVGYGLLGIWEIEQRVAGWGSRV